MHASISYVTSKHFLRTLFPKKGKTWRTTLSRSKNFYNISFPFSKHMFFLARHQICRLVKNATLTSVLFFLEVLHRMRQSVPKGLTRKLDLSHFLSTWNSRVFEFGAVLYLASIYPGTLLPLSVDDLHVTFLQLSVRLLCDNSLIRVIG